MSAKLGATDHIYSDNQQLMSIRPRSGYLWCPPLENIVPYEMKSREEGICFQNVNPVKLTISFLSLSLCFSSFSWLMSPSLLFYLISPSGFSLLWPSPRISPKLWVPGYYPTPWLLPQQWPLQLPQTLWLSVQQHLRLTHTITSCKVHISAMPS